MRKSPHSQSTPLLSAILVAALAVGTPLALIITFTKWEDSIQRQIAVVVGLLAIGALLLFRRKYEILLLAIVVFTQAQVSLYSVVLDEPAKLQIFLTDVLLLLFLVAGLERRERIRPDRMGWIFLLLILWQILASAFSAHVDRSVIYVIWECKYLLIYLLVRNIDLTEKFAGQLKLAVFIVIGLQGALALAQQVSGGTLGLVVFGEQDRSTLFYVNSVLRVSGTLGATNTFAGYMATILVFVLPMMFRKQNPVWFVLYGLGTLALLLTFSRAGWLSVAIGGVLVVFGLMRAGVVRLGRIVVVSILLLAVTGVGVAKYFSEVQFRFEDRDARRSAEGRLTQFTQYWPAIERFPIVGIGPGVTEYLGAWNNHRQYVQGKLKDIYLGNQPHSSQLQYWIESGTPGAALWLFIMLMVLARPFARAGPEGAASELNLLRIGASAAAATAMIDASFGTGINSYQFSLLFWIFVGISRNPSLGSFQSKHRSGPERLDLTWDRLTKVDGRMPWMPRR